MDKSQADDLFELILKFAGYGFNKSHSTCYAIIAYQTAFPDAPPALGTASSGTRRRRDASPSVHHQSSSPLAPPHSATYGLVVVSPSPHPLVGLVLARLTAQMSSSILVVVFGLPGKGRCARPIDLTARSSRRRR